MILFLWTKLTRPPGCRFLQSVTYGPTGLEYTAVGCQVLADAVISCLTAQGVGQQHRWIVTVEGQTSDISTATTSYALPRILSAQPLTGVTNGGTIITINGKNLATFNQPQTHFAASLMNT